MTMMMMSRMRNSRSILATPTAALLLLLLLSGSEAGTASFQVGTVPTQPVVLTKDNFRTAIQDPANSVWFLKFFAPWCGHCKRMIPVLNKVAGPVAGQMAIGTIDCTATASKPLCDEYGVRGYPTLKFSVDGTVHDYAGGRDEAALLQFARKLNRPVVTAVSTVQQVYDQADQEALDGVVFVVYHPDIIVGPPGDDDPKASLENKLQIGGTLTQLYGSVARQERANGIFLLLETTTMNDGDSKEIHFPGESFGLSDNKNNNVQPFLCRIEPNVPPRCMDQTATDDESHQLRLETMLSWVREQNVPTIAKLGPRNFHSMGAKGRALVIGVVADHTDTAQVQTMRTILTDFAMNGPPAIRNKYYYGWFEGKKWAKFLEQFNVLPANMPQIFVLDVPTKKYWQDASYPLTDLERFLVAIDEGKVGFQYGGKKGLEGWIKRNFLVPLVDYAPWSIIALVFALVALFVVIAMNISPGKDLRPPYPREVQEASEAERAAAGETKTDDDNAAAEKEEKETETKKDK